MLHSNKRLLQNHQDSQSSSSMFVTLIKPPNTEHFLQTNAIFGSRKYTSRVVWYFLQIVNCYYVNSGFDSAVLCFTAPSSCVQNASSFLITDKDSFVAWRNTPIELLHGVFHGFNIDITEQLQDGIILQRRAFIINKTLTQEADMYGRSIQFNMAANVSNAYIWNKTDNLNKSAEYFYLNLIGLKAYAFYNVTLASCTRPGCGPQCRSVFLTKERGEPLTIFLKLSCGAASAHTF